MTTSAESGAEREFAQKKIVRGLALALLLTGAAHAQSLPDAPGFLLTRADVDPLAGQQSGETALSGMTPQAPVLPPPCNELQGPPLRGANPAAPACGENPIQLIVTRSSRPLSSHEKGILAIKDMADPFNILVITAGAGISVAANSHSAYGPGFEGWGRLTGYSFVEEAQGEFLGTYLISSLTHEDPRYHRMPDASVKRRIAHALSHTVWTRHDDGRPMLNYETLLTYPASAELSNLYVPGVQTDAAATGRRIGIGLATDPVGNIIAEFLPDFAKRVHVRVVFMQQILNQVAQGAPGVM